MPASPDTPRGPYQRQPHPLEPQLRELIAQGMNNTQIIEQLFAPPKVVARVRTDMGVPPAPRSTWRRKPHSKTREIHTLLEDGHNDAEIRRRTGADIRVIARMRTAGGYGKPTVARRGRRHPREAEIRGLLAEHSTTQIAAMLGVDRAAVRRIRAEAGITYTAGSYATPREKWRARTEPVEGGHLRWTGATSHGTPTVRFNGGSHSAYRVAFRLQHDREPQGRVTATCDMPGCVSGWHVADQPMRNQTDALCEAIFGEAA